MANTLAYGFVRFEQLANERVTTIGERVVLDAIQESAAEHSRQMSAMMAGLAQYLTDHTLRFKQPGSGTLQPIDEQGDPLPVQERGYYDVAFPIQGGGTAWGDNRVSRALMTVDEANRMTVENLRRDADWVMRHILAALFTNVTWTYADPEYGNLTIQPLANDDAVEYLKIDGTSATDTHFLAQADAIDDAHDPFPTIYDELREHMGNTGPFVVFVPPGLTASIEALTDFVAVGDPDIDLGVTEAAISASITGIRGWGQEVLGKTSHCWVVEAQRLPAGYMIAQAIGAGAVLGARQYPASELQGYFVENDAGDGNLRKTKMIRYLGFGALNRVAALAYRVGNGSYAIPAGYTAPLPV